MWLVLKHADQVRGLISHEFIPVPWVFLEACCVYLSNTIEGGNAELFGAKSDDRAMLLVGGEDGAAFKADSTFPPYPYWCDGGSEVSIGDLGERRDASWFNDILVEQEQEQGSCAKSQKKERHGCQ